MYQVPDMLNRSMQQMDRAAGTFGQMQRKMEPPKKTAGGAIGAAAGMGMAGAMAAKEGLLTGIGVASGGAGLALGAGLGLASYFLS